MSERSRINIFDYNELLPYLSAVVDDFTNRGYSQRKIAQIFEINSPGYLKAILASERKIGPKVAEKWMKALGYTATEKKAFQILLMLEQSLDTSEKAQLFEKLLNMKQSKEAKRVDDIEFFGTWLHPVILEMLEIKSIKKAEQIYQRLSTMETKANIDQALKWLQKRKYIHMDEKGGIKKAANFEFTTYDDKRRIIDIQNNHMFFLNLARHRLAQDLKKREFQSLTLALNSQRLPELKEHIRKFIRFINTEFSYDPKADSLYQIELAAFAIDNSKIPQ